MKQVNSIFFMNAGKSKLLLFITKDSIHVDSQIINESNVIILTYSISSVDSFRNVLRKWKPILDKKNVSCPIVLAGKLLNFLIT